MASNAKPNEIMITGSGRSGTTWLASIFDSHPDTFYLHEPEWVLSNPIMTFAPGPDEIEALEDDARRLYRAMRSVRGLRAVSKRPLFLKSYRGPAARLIRNALMVSLGAAGRFVDTTAIPIPDLIRTGQRDRVVSVIKSVVANMRLPVLARALPDVRFVLIVRHPCGVAASLERGIREAKMAAPRVYDAQLALPPAAKHGLDREAADQLSPDEAAAAVWMITNEYAMETTRDQANVRILKYEDLCADPLAVGRDLFSWVGLPWAAETEDFIGLSLDKPDDSSAYHAVVRNPLVAANRWKETLSPYRQTAIRSLVAGSAPARLFPDLEKE